MMCKITNRIANEFLIDLIFIFYSINDLISNYQRNVVCRYFYWKLLMKILHCQFH